MCIFVSVCIRTIALFYLCYLFVSLLLLFYYNVYVECIGRSLHNITTQQQQQQRKLSTIYLSMVYFTFFSPLFFCLLYDLKFFLIVSSISKYYWLLRFLYRISNNNRRNQHQHQESIGTIDMMFVLHCINHFNYFYVFILRPTLYPNIFLRLSALTSQTSIFIFIS